MRLDCTSTPTAGPVAIDWTSAARQQIDDHLHLLLEAAHPSRVTEAMRYAVLSPGKRLRPLLMMAVADFLGARRDSIVPVACAVEMIHAASLVLDDLPCMDNDRERRNRPSTHAVYGEDCSILAAVSLLMHAHAILAGHDGLPPAVRLKMIHLLCETIGSSGLSLGQYIDLASKSAPAAPDAITNVHHLKTGILFLAAARAGCLMCDASPAQEAKVLAYTTSLGLAFQLKDDLTDIDAPGLNLASRIGVSNAERQFQRHLRRAHAAIEGEDCAEVLTSFTNAVFARH
ncbi:MAG TPA: polyprenyl synthetase family protein [Noviherbaspirillum sp.]|jgi:geranylgeranyl diphosphate synthase type II|uniref:polyprenyl synthetase family protein n=1 Tax=Noviherbaspirillum sp. TaxID=1926288 RepID=UPI002F942719